MKIAIIGAGIAGLAAAYDLHKAGCEVVVYEAADYVGGLASGFKEPHWDWSVERYYHHWFASDKHILGLMEELGLRSKVLFTRPVTAVYHEGDFYPLDSALAVLRFPGLPFFDRIRMGMVVALLKMLPDWRSLERVTADVWMRRWVGDRAYRSMWEPLLIGKFGDHYKDVNMAWMWARFKARTPRLGTYQGGFQAFVEDLAAKLRELGVEIHLQTPVQKIEALPAGGIRISLQDGTTDVDQCLATISPQLLSRLTPDMPSSYLNQLLSLKSMGAVVVVFALKHRLSEKGVYWHNLPKDAGFPFLALVEHTNFLPAEHFGDEHIVYCGDYLDPEHAYFNLDQNQLVEHFLPSMARINPAFTPDWVRKTWMFRTRYAQPVPGLEQSKVIPALRTPLPGLWFASMSQVYPWDRGTNFAVQLAREAAAQILEEFFKER